MLIYSQEELVVQQSSGILQLSHYLNTENEKEVSETQIGLITK